MSIFLLRVGPGIIQNLVENGPVVSEKSKSSYVNDIGPRSRNDLDLQYSQIFIKSQAAIVSENPVSLLFPTEVNVTKIDVAVK